MRTGSLQATKCNRGGTRPLARFGLLHSDTDPALFQLWHVLQSFCEPFKNSPVISDWWKLFSESVNDSIKFEPFRLQIDDTACIWFAQHGCLDLSICSDAVLLQSFRRAIAKQACECAGLQDLEGFDYTLTVSSDGKFQPHDVAMLLITRNGSFITNQHKKQI